ncbi:hypothetical protein L7F22_031572 [Adiantum nelumboides]|nr:hypothetical protein [Adiantum nelumboides]
MEHLRAVFEMLQKERLVVNGKKSEFFMEEIHFLGHIVSKDGVRMDPARQSRTSQNQSNFMRALSRRPHVAAVSIAYQHELDEIRDYYSSDEDFAELMTLLFMASILIRHRGIDSTIKALEMYFFWPSLQKDTESFVRSCLVCERVKYDRGKAYGLLQPLPIPTAPWESIAMDFIFGLPKTSSGNEGIWTIVDRFSKQAHFIPVWKQITSEQMAKNFLITVFKYHGMPRSIIVNSAVLDLLKCYISDNPAQCEHYLPLVEFAYNNTIHISPGKAPFEIVGGAQNPPPMVKVMDDFFEADKFAEDLDLAYQQVQQAILKAQEKQKKAADKHRCRLHYREGDWVLLQFEKARLRKQKGKKKFYMKLQRRYYEPFQIIEY